MADRYWVGGTGSWDITNTANWSATSGGAGGASFPTAADAVIFNVNSNIGTTAFTVTVIGAVPCLSLTISGLDAVMTLAGSGTINCAGSLSYPATNLTHTFTGIYSFSGAGATITTNGVAITATQINFGGAASYTLGSALTATNAAVTHTAGTLVLGAFTSTVASYVCSGGGAKTINFSGAGTTILICSGASGFVLDAGSTFSTASASNTLRLSAASPTLTTAGDTLGLILNWSSTATGTLSITDTATITTFSSTTPVAGASKTVSLGGNFTATTVTAVGLSGSGRQSFRSSVLGTARTLTYTTWTTKTDLDFMDISASPTITGTRIGNAGGNTGVTASASRTVFWNLAAGGNWSTSTAWASTAGGTPATSNFPLPQDIATFTTAGLSTGNTVTLTTSHFLPEITASGKTNAGTISISLQAYCVGNVNLGAALTIADTGPLYFIKRGATQTLSSGGGTFTVTTMGTLGGSATTLQLISNITCVNFDFFGSTLNLNNFALSVSGAFDGSGTTARTLAFGTSGTVNLTRTATSNLTIWDTAPSTNLTITGTPVVNVTGNTSSGTRTLTAGNLSEAEAPSFNVSAGSSGVNITGNVKNLNFTGFSGNIATNTRTIYGNLTIPAAVTTTSTTDVTTFAATSGTQDITTNGAVLNFPVEMTGAGTRRLQTALAMSNSLGSLTHTEGTLNLNNFNLTCSFYLSSNTNTRSLLANGSIITLTQTTGTPWDTTTSTNMTFTGSTSEIVFQPATTTTFSYGGLNNFGTITLNGTGALSIPSAITLNRIRNTSASGTVTLGGTMNVSLFDLSGTSAGNLINLNSSASGTQRTLIKTGGGTVSVSFMSIQDSNATGGTWNALLTNGNVDSGNNTGWFFGTAYSLAPNFFQFF